MKLSELTPTQVREYKRILKWILKQDREALVQIAAECAFACREMVEATNNGGGIEDWPDLLMAVRQASIATELVPGCPSLHEEPENDPSGA